MVCVYKKEREREREIDIERERGEGDRHSLLQKKRDFMRGAYSKGEKRTEKDEVMDEMVTRRITKRYQNVMMILK